MATRRAASSRKPTPHTAVMTRKTCRKPSYRQRPVISRPLAVSGPMNSRAKPYISGRRVHSEPRQPAPNMAVGTDPSISTSRALWLTRPSTVPASIPAKTTSRTRSRRSPRGWSGTRRPGPGPRPSGPPRQPSMDQAHHRRTPRRSCPLRAAVGLVAADHAGVGTLRCESAGRSAVNEKRITGETSTAGNSAGYPGKLRAPVSVPLSTAFDRAAPQSIPFWVRDGRWRIMPRWGGRHFTVPGARIRRRPPGSSRLGAEDRGTVA